MLEYQVTSIFKGGALTINIYQSFAEAREDYENHRNSPHVIGGHMFSITYKKNLFGKLSIKSTYRVMGWGEPKNIDFDNICK